MLLMGPEMYHMEPEGFGRTENHCPGLTQSPVPRQNHTLSSMRIQRAPAWTELLLLTTALVALGPQHPQPQD